MSAPPPNSERYWYSIREMDSSWSDWIECSRDYYDRVSGRSDVSVCTTKDTQP